MIWNEWLLSGNKKFLSSFVSDDYDDISDIYVSAISRSFRIRYFAVHISKFMRVYLYSYISVQIKIFNSVKSMLKVVLFSAKYSLQGFMVKRVIYDTEIGDLQVKKVEI